MSTIQDLQQQETHLLEAIATSKAELDELRGDDYRDCWMDETQDPTGKKIYTRLWWFDADRRKRCRTLKREEIGRARKAIALWAELTQLEAELAHVGGELRKAEATAEALGLEVPRVSTARRKGSDRKTVPESDGLPPPDF